MSSRVYRENYLAALEVAHSELDRIIGEFDSLQLRKEQIEGAVGALEPFLSSAPLASHETRQPGPADYEIRQHKPIHAEPVQIVPEPEIVQPVLRAAPVPAPEPVAPPAFSPMSAAKIDPIQSRINRALGLAVA
jgi:hypothetical protein